MSNDLVKYDPSIFAVAPAGELSIAEVLAENLGGESLSPSDLDKIKVPSGGGTMWDVPYVDGEKQVKDLDCVVVYSRMTRSFYATEFTGGSNPPDCYSPDCLHGIGVPGGECLTCPNADWESDPKGGKGKACKERRLMFLLLPGAQLPVVLRIPPSSLKKAKQYLLRLVSINVPMPCAITRMTLSKEKNDGGIAYSGINFAFVSKVSDPDAFLAQARALRPMLDGSLARFAQEAPEDEAPV